MTKLTQENRTAIADAYKAGESAPTLGRRYAVSANTIRNWLHALGVPTRVSGHNFFRGGPRLASRACEKCGKTFTYADHRAQRYRRFCGWPCRATWAGSTHHNAKQERRFLRAGNWWISLTDEERASPVHHHPKGKAWHRGSRIVPEHVFIAEEALGRRLKAGEVVHHVNCDHLDNRRGNLLICDRTYHAWLHGEMARRYGQEHFGGAN